MTLRRKLTWIFILFSISTFAQQQVRLLANWDYRRKIDNTEKINQVITATNGDIVAVGETMSESFQDLDALLLVLDPHTGETKLWKRFGGVGDQSLSDIAQNPDGTLTAVGFNQGEGKEREGWIVALAIEDGEVINAKPATGLPGTSHEILKVAINDEGAALAIARNSQGRSMNTRLLHIDPSFTIKEIPLGEISEHTLTDITTDQQDFYLMANATRYKKAKDVILVKKMDEKGKDLWDGLRSLGDQKVQRGTSMAYNHSDAGLIIAGTTDSESSGMTDIWLVKLDLNGQLRWEQKYGGKNTDVVVDVMELTMGGFAILGHTWSHAPRATTSVLQLIVTDADGVEIDSDILHINDATQDQFGCALTESPASKNIVVVGNSRVEKSPHLNKTALSSISYLVEDLALDSDDDETFGSASEETRLEITSAHFMDANQNHYLERGERGYLEWKLDNTESDILKNVVAKISSDQKDSGLDMWNQVYIGQIRPNQTKTLRVPVKASGAIDQHSYACNLKLYADGNYIGSTSARIATNRPNPANLVVNTYDFTPEENPQPGEPITLTFELENLGGKASVPLDADFQIPPGVQAKRSERLQVPALAPNQSHQISFTFSYLESYTDPNIQISFVTNSTKEIAGLKQSFTLPVSTAAVASVADPAPIYNNEIHWITPDIEEYRTIDVRNDQVDLKVIALSSEPMSKRNFGVLINGRQVQGQKLDEAELSPPANVTTGRVKQSYANSARLKEGLNEVQIIYYNEDGTIAKSVPLTFNYIPKDKPNLHVLSIGVKHDDLRYTVNDARAFANMYRKLKDANGRGFNKVVVHELVTEEQTTENYLKRAFADLSKNRNIKDNDLVVVFISSHGKVIDGDRYVLLPSDYESQYEDLTTVDFKNDILKRLNTVEGNKLVFIDACHSGSAGARSFSDAAASKVMNDLIEATAGMEIFASCGHEEFSYEDESWGNGAFTKAICEAFRNEVVEINGKKIQADQFKEVNGKKVTGQDGVITIEELKNYVRIRVPHLVKSVKKKDQNPTNKSTDLLPADMGIYMVNR